MRPWVSTGIRLEPQGGAGQGSGLDDALHHSTTAPAAQLSRDREGCRVLAGTPDAPSRGFCGRVVSALARPTHNTQ